VRDVEGARSAAAPFRQPHSCGWRGTRPVPSGYQRACTASDEPPDPMPPGQPAPRGTPSGHCCGRLPGDRRRRPTQRCRDRPDRAPRREPAGDLLPLRQRQPRWTPSPRHRSDPAPPDQVRPDRAGAQPQLPRRRLRRLPGLQPDPHLVDRRRSQPLESPCATKHLLEFRKCSTYHLRPPRDRCGSALCLSASRRTGVTGSA